MTLIPYDSWRKRIHASRATAWRYRRDGKIKAINRCGRLYIEAAEAERFDERMRAGDFAMNKKLPDELRRSTNRPSKSLARELLRRLRGSVQ